MILLDRMRLANMSNIMRLNLCAIPYVSESMAYHAETDNNLKLKTQKLKSTKYKTLAAIWYARVLTARASDSARLYLFFL